MNEWRDLKTVAKEVNSLGHWQQKVGGNSLCHRFYLYSSVSVSPPPSTHLAVCSIYPPPSSFNDLLHSNLSPDSDSMIVLMRNNTDRKLAMTGMVDWMRMVPIPGLWKCWRSSSATNRATPPARHPPLLSLSFLETGFHCVLAVLELTL